MYAPPPAYYKQFKASKDALQAPDLECLSKKDYFILFQSTKKVHLRGDLTMARHYNDKKSEAPAIESMAAVEGASKILDDDEMVLIDDDGDRLMEIAGQQKPSALANPDSLMN